MLNPVNDKNWKTSCPQWFSLNLTCDQNSSLQEMDPGDKGMTENKWTTKLTKELGELGYVRVSLLNN